VSCGNRQHTSNLKGKLLSSYAVGRTSVFPGHVGKMNKEPHSLEGEGEAFFSMTEDVVK
jgi:hypothetical protein